LYRLYVDEVGTDAITHLDKDKHRYLSLTGVAMDLEHAARKLEPNMNWIKARVLGHDPDSPAILYRTEIMGFKGIYKCLNEPHIHTIFDKSILRLMESTQYTVITAFLDKQAMMKKQNWKNKEPYLYLMDIVVERYVQFLERTHSIGDIMPEKRGNPKDASLQSAYEHTRGTGTYYVSKQRIESSIRAKSLKFRAKRENISGLQLCDLLAHPSHMITGSILNHNVTLGAFCLSVRDILMSTKYDRSKSGLIIGYGIKVAS
jgi:hypothetical protein